VSSLSMTGPGMGRCRGAPKPGALCPDGGRCGCTSQVALHECSRGGVVCCWNWSEASHVLVELDDEMRWIHCVSRQSQ
jgi:hypothetical protein